MQATMNGPRFEPQIAPRSIGNIAKSQPITVPNIQTNAHSLAPHNTPFQPTKLDFNPIPAPKLQVYLPAQSNNELQKVFAPSVHINQPPATTIRLNHP